MLVDFEDPDRVIRWDTPGELTYAGVLGADGTLVLSQANEHLRAVEGPRQYPKDITMKQLNRLGKAACDVWIEGRQFLQHVEVDSWVKIMEALTLNPAYLSELRWSVADIMGCQGTILRDNALEMLRRCLAAVLAYAQKIAYLSRVYKVYHEPSVCAVTLFHAKIPESKI
jgi:hypothetical protein